MHLLVIHVHHSHANAAAMIEMLIVNALGLTFVAIALRDVLHELYHPAGSGPLARSLRRAVWRAFHWYARGRAKRLRMAGPVVLVATITVWAVLVVVGFALVYLPYLPEHFRFASPLDPAAEDGIGVALYLSLVASATLGFGDITPTHFLLRVASTLEAFVGFLLLTAGMSWALSIKPILAERRALALIVSGLRDTEHRLRMGLDQLDPGVIRPLLAQLTERIALITTRLLQAPETYYFHVHEDAFSMAAMLPFLSERVNRIALGTTDASTRFQALALIRALDGLATVIAGQFLRIEEASTDQILNAYAQDHLRAASSTPRT